MTQGCLTSFYLLLPVASVAGDRKASLVGFPPGVQGDKNQAIIHVASSYPLIHSFHYHQSRACVDNALSYPRGRQGWPSGYASPAGLSAAAAADAALRPIWTVANESFSLRRSAASNGATSIFVRCSAARFHGVESEVDRVPV